VTVLSDGGLITTRAAGRERFNALDPDGFAPMRGWIGFFDHFWDEHLTNPKDAIENSDKKGQHNDCSHHTKINIPERRPPNAYGISDRP
jgi:hypothetical protein